MTALFFWRIVFIIVIEWIKKMDISRLETFCKVYEVRSFSVAARELYISQPTVSTHILFLERQLSQPLFDRVGKSVIPTRAGEMLYKYAIEIIRLIRQAKEEIQMLSNKMVGEVKVGGSTIPANYILPFVLNSYREKYPEVSISLQIGDSVDVQNKVCDGLLEIGVVGAAGDMGELVFDPFLEDELVFVGKRSYLEGCDTLEDILRLPWIMREKGSGTRRAIEEGLLKEGVRIKDLNIRAMVFSTEVLLKCIKEGVGISVTSRLAAAELMNIPDMAVKIFPFLQFQREFYVVYHSQRTFFPATVAFLKELERTKEFFKFSIEKEQE